MSPHDDVSAASPSADARVPCLRHRPDPYGDPVCVALTELPFGIGRSRRMALVLDSQRVSKEHAVIEAHEAGGMRVRDANSRNGTFVNGERVTDARPLQIGDVLQIAHRELEVVFAEPRAATSDEPTLAGAATSDGERRVQAGRDLLKILTGRRVRAVFQPIINLADGRTTIGYESLGRHTLERANYDCAALFAVAAEERRAEALSQLMRAAALSDIQWLPNRGPRLFMNVHPHEMSDDPERLLAELEHANEVLGDRVLVAEIHEGAVSDPAQMRELRAALRERSIELAYDDFGAGRSRLMELAEVPPDFLKLDMGLVRGIDESPSRREIVAALVRVMLDMGVRVIAEGIETEGELTTVRDLGCELGQGFWIRHPAAVGDLRDTMS